MRVGYWSGLLLAVIVAAASLYASGEDGAAKATPLADAVKSRDKQAILALLKKKADVNAPQSDGATPLHWAAYWEDAETTGMLLHAGAQVNSRNKYGVTPLALA